MSNPPSDPRPQPLSVLPVEEGSCLLRSYALHPIPRNPGEVVILYYSQDPERGGETDEGQDNRPDQCGEMVIVPEGQLYTPGTATKTDGGEAPTTTDGEAVPIGTKINGKYAHTSQKAYSTIWVMDRVGCEIPEATKFINAVVGAPSKAPEVLKADSLDRYFTIFVSIPYLGVGYDHPLHNESRTLRQYRLRQPTNIPVNQTTPTATPTAKLDILVHQTWLLSFNDERIGIFRSKDDHYSDRAPLFPYQKRMAASQAFVHMICNLLTSSENKALKIFHSKVKDLELKLEDSSTSPEDRKEAFKSYGSYIRDVSTMIRIVRSQIGYLKDLRQIFENSYDSKRLTGEPRPHRNSYPIPLLRKQAEQLEDVMKSLTAVIVEREGFYKELRILVKDLELAKTLSLEIDQVESRKTVEDTLIEGQITPQAAVSRALIEGQIKTQAAVSQALMAQTKAQAKLDETLKEQGQTISVFTLVTAVFLPLGFFCSYYAIPENLGGARFWSVAGPVTAAMTVVMALFLWAPDDKIKEKLEVWRRSAPKSDETEEQAPAHQAEITPDREASQSPETPQSPGFIVREKTRDSVSQV